MNSLPRLATFALLLFPGATFAQSFVMPQDLSEIERQRFARFESFQIKGVCGNRDLERLATFGVNTVRGYTIPSTEKMLEKLDEAHRLGIKMVVSEWMPHHGQNKGRNGSVWEFDYNAKGDEMVEKFIEKIEGIGDHPAILMWGLGNEVHLDEPYLRVVNRMSRAIHERFPHHLTSLTIINAPEKGIAAIKEFAPDIDVLGVQSYSRGAVRGTIRKTEALWGKPFYFSEFNTNGPWNFKKAPWGIELDEPVTSKVSDLKDCYAAIDASPLCLGSTIFVWGHHTVFRPTYFSTLLDPNPNGTKDAVSLDHLFITPQAEVLIEHFTGRPIQGNRAPAISKLEFDGGLSHRLAAPAEMMKVNFAADDADGDPVEFVTWILDSTQRRTTTVAGPLPQASSGHALISAPQQPGEYLLLVYAKDGKGGASASTIAFKVPEPDAEAVAPEPVAALR